ncbi:TPA: SWIM zinc finger family protein [Neisseria meningitidis]
MPLFKNSCSCQIFQTVFPCRHKTPPVSGSISFPTPRQYLPALPCR